MLTLRDNLPGRCGSTWRRGYEPAAASSARDKDRPLSPSPSSVFWSPLLPAATGRAPLPASGRPAAPSLAVGLSCHPRPRVFTLHFSLIARFCKLVSISMLHLLPFTVFARPCGKKRGAQRKANPLTAQEGEAPGTAALKVRVLPFPVAILLATYRSDPGSKIKQPVGVIVRWDKANYTGLANYNLHSHRKTSAPGALAKQGPALMSPCMWLLGS